MNIKKILANADKGKVISLLTVRPSWMPASDTATIKKQWDPKQHKVFDLSHRPKREVRKSATEISVVDVARIAFPLQKTIVRRAASFLFGSEVQLNYNYGENESLKKVGEMLQRILSTNKSGNLNKQIARKLFSETEVAEYWYPVEDPLYWGDKSVSKYKLRCRLFSPFLGDKLYPHFDDYGDMDAFSRAYVMKETSDTGGEVAVDYLDCFTKEGVYRFKKLQEGWAQIKVLEVDPVTQQTKEAEFQSNPIPKIPIVYYYQEETDWSDVQALIERFEDTISNFADTNDYFGKPILTVDGKVVSLPDKGESGKIIELQQGAKAAYLTWDQAPEAVKLELDTLEQAIYSNSQTPNISFERLKGLGSISGIALKLTFIDAHLKVEDKKEIFTPALQRRFNIIKAYIGQFEKSLEASASQLEVEPVITPYMPSNEQELIDYLTTGTAGKAIISRKTAIKLGGLVDDADAELEQIQKEEGESAGNPTF